MASTVIHMCVAKKINEKLNYKYNMLILGTIAPDISKHIGKTKKIAISLQIIQRFQI